jgi:hypothetical protein
MMGKASSRKRVQAESPESNIHEEIEREARRAREAPQPGFSEDGYPALSGLLRAVQAEVNQSTPTRIVYQGRPYWCRVSHGMTLIEVFDSPAKAEPMARTVCGSTDVFGHSPCH